MKRNLSASCSWILLVAGMSLCARAPAQDTATDLIVHYSFDDETDLGRDASGNGHSGVPVGAPVPVAGPFGGAAYFGLDQYLRVDELLGEFPALSVSVWLNIDSLGDFRSILHCDGWEPGDLHFFVQSGPVQFSVNQDAPTDQQSSGAIVPGEWHHVAAAYDSSAGTVDFYIDGVHDVQLVYGASRSVILGPLAVAAWNAGDRDFLGAMDEIAIYGRALSESDVVALLEGPPEPSPGLAYRPPGVLEDPANDGSISEAIAIELSLDTFAADVVSGGHVSASNVPAGLTAVFTRDSDSRVTLGFSGRATRHSAADSATDLTVAFSDGAFATSPAAAVQRSTKADLTITFFDPPDIDAGLVAYYSFDDCGNLGADDSGSGNDGVVAGNTTCTAGGAARFDGVGDSVRIGSFAGPFDALSVAVWVNVRALNNDFRAIYDCDGWEPGDLHFQLYQNPGIVRFSVNGNAPGDQDSAFRLTADVLGAWHHLAAVYDRSAARVDLYIDGALDVSRTYAAAGPISLGPSTIGAWNGTMRFYDGALDDLRIYGRTLTPEEVQELSEAEISVESPPEFVGVPAKDFTTPGAAYSRQLTILGDPRPTLEVIEPAGATISEDGLLSYAVPDPAPGSFTVSLRAENGVGAPAEATWVVYVSEPGLKGLWCLEDGGGLVAADSAGGADAALVNMDGGTAWIAGEISDGALAFDGIDDHLLIVTEGEEFLSLHRDFTWAAWVSTTVGGTILSKSPTADPWAPGSMALFVRDGALTLDVGWVGYAASVGTIHDGLWHHVAATATFDVLGDADEVQLYIDGAPDGFVGGWDIEAAGWPPGDLKAGFASPDFPPTGSHLSGALDEIRIWDRALTTEEILDVFQSPGDGCDGGPPGPEFRRGDPNGDGSVNITDGIFVLNFLFLGGPTPPCMEAADPNDDGAVNITDGIYILNFLFLGGPDPVAPGTAACGRDATGSPGNLGCESYTEC